MQGHAGKYVSVQVTWLVGAVAFCNFRHFIPNSGLNGLGANGLVEGCHIFGPLQQMVLSYVHLQPMQGNA